VGDAGEPLSNKYFGKYRGWVVDSGDPMNRGRLRVTTPTVLGDQEVWAMPCVPYAGEGVGFVFRPRVGTGVWVEFEAGDPSAPIWSGFYWADGQLPDNPSAATANFIRTPAMSVVFDDDVPAFRVAVDGGVTLTLSGGEPSVG
jgi:hypothetical protein